MSGARLSSAIFSLLALCAISASAHAQPKRLLILGDSLSAGYGVPEGNSFTWALNRRLHMRGHRDVVVLDDSQNGASTTDFVRRLPKSFAYGADAVIVELGGNDMLQKENPAVVYRNLQAIVRYSKARGSRVLLAGMLSYPYQPNLAYKLGFDGVYPTLAARERVPLYPFFLEGVYGNRNLMQSDNEHPNAVGADYIAARMTPWVERELQALDRRRYHAAR
ncbi:MAG: GDSL-type esterase/lipase family protein [Methylocystis sp.]